MPERDPIAAPPQPRDSQAPELAEKPAGLEFCVVGVGASAGGLNACQRFFAALPASPGMAFILVQHLDPTHDSMMAELLAADTSMSVVQAQDGMMVARDHVYLIPPGLYIAIADGKLNLSVPLARHGTRLPFDFLLQSLAVYAGPLAACVILSGGGADGTIGAKAIKAAGGLVIAQDPAEASHQGMPSNAIATGIVDFILPVAEIAASLLVFAHQPAQPRAASGTAEIIALLKSMTTHDFTLYKTGTMDRRIARRMTIAGFNETETARYMDRLRDDPEERNQLANDLLINVTSFFRDPNIFDLLADKIIPELIDASDGSIRLWIAGCSTGEETYSLAMLLQERIEVAKKPVHLQIFATDIDARALLQAREGLYPASIAQDVTPSRLQRFFTRDEHGFRVSPALRACVVFAVQDVLSDPPFSKLNMVSCRNLLIYLQPEAQEKLISVFNFSLRSGGFLLLGTAETVAATDKRFEQVSRPARLYRKLMTGNDHMPHGTPGADALRLLPHPAMDQTKAVDYGAIFRKLVLDRYGPAALIVNGRFECLYHMGPTDMFLRAPAGPATHDLLPQLPPGLRSRMRGALPLSPGEPVRRVQGGRITRDGKTKSFDIEIQAVPNDADKFLVCFITQPDAPPALPSAGVSGAEAGSRIAALEAELAATRVELQLAVHGLEQAAEEHSASHEEALSVNEEYQSTNEELLTSKEELQSLNEELTALNSQLQGSLERSRMTSNDLRNVLRSTEVPTLFLDERLMIRFFTPSATQLFHLLPNDIGRKLEDFRSLAADPALLADAAHVLASGAPLECEIVTSPGTAYQRRIQAYRTDEGAIAGVVITFNDITARKAATAAMESARLSSEQANLTKSRFLAAASHDLRQPLQTMALINGMLARTVTDPAAQKLTLRLDQTMQSIIVMLNAMLDINQIEAGIIQPEISTLRVDDLFDRLRKKFQDQAVLQATDLRFVPCSLSIQTDPALLEQMLTNLLGNALKYTKAGRVLIGMRRRKKTVRIEVWDSGIGIAADQLENIFEEYHQLNNPARERAHGLGLGLSIVQRLGRLLGHKISVRSIPGKGSGFAVEILRATKPAAAQPALPHLQRPTARAAQAALLVIEDDPDIGQLLKTFLTGEGFRVVVATDGVAAKAIVASGASRPDLILADYNLPGAQNGLAVAHDLQTAMGRHVPVVIMTGDISTATLQRIAANDCVQMNKPMKLAELLTTLETLLARAGRQLAGGSPATPPDIIAGPRIFIVDDEAGIRDAMRTIFEQADMRAFVFPDAESFLAAMPEDTSHCCLLIDAALPGISGLQLLQKLAAGRIALPSIMVTGLGDIDMAVQAMKAGAADFMEKPVKEAELLACVRRVLDEKQGDQAVAARQREAARQIGDLTERQREIMDRVLAGQPSKNIAADLGISQRTVENHRAAVMQKTGAKSIPELARLAMLALKQPPA